MSENTKIQWAHHTYNPWRGCRKVAPECANCYITSTPPFRMTGQKHGPERVRAGVKALAEPLKWDAAAAKAGERHRVFCLSLGDWLDDENVPAEWLAELLTMIYATANLDWLLLTKRPQNFIKRMNAAAKVTGLRGYELIEDWQAGEPPPNVWIGVSAGADQAAALAIPAKVHFLSAEPMLGTMDTAHAAEFDWIIFGGESGPNARACNMDWIDEGLALCRTFKVKAFVKQLGSNVVYAPRLGVRRAIDSGWPLVPYGETVLPRKIVLADRKGGDPAEWPADLRVREFPKP